MEEQQAALAGTGSAERERIQSLLALRRPKEALAIAAAWSGRDPDDYDARFALASCQLAAEQLDDADQTCRRLVAELPEDPDAHILLSRVAQFRHDFGLEYQAAENAIRLSPDYERALDRWARAQLNSGMPKKARETALRLKQIAVDDSDVDELLAEIALDTGNTDESLSAVKRALAEQPDNPSLLNDLGRSQLTAKHHRQAIDSFFAAAQLDMHEPVYRQNLCLAVWEWLESKQSGPSKEKALQQLPQGIQNLYQDHRSRRHWTAKLGLYGIGALFLVGLIVLTWLLDSLALK